jgi:transcriptional regulator with XRE-family HTH domain
MKRPDLLKFIARIGTTQTKLAKKLNLSKGFINQVVNGKSTVSYETILNLAKEGINAEELLGEELGAAFCKRCYEEFLAKNNMIPNIENNKKLTEGIKTAINGLNLVLQGCGKGFEKV